jgi:hypothetical protein
MPQPEGSRLAPSKRPRAGRVSRGQTLAEKRLFLRSGILGRLFGCSANAAMNVSGLTVLLLTLTGVVTLYVPCGLRPDEYFKIATPIVTLALGYMFGRHPG